MQPVHYRRVVLTKWESSIKRIDRRSPFITCDYWLSSLPEYSTRFVARDTLFVIFNTLCLIFFFLDLFNERYIVTLCQTCDKNVKLVKITLNRRFKNWCSNSIGRSFERTKVKKLEIQGGQWKTEWFKTKITSASTRFLLLNYKVNFLLLYLEIQLMDCFSVLRVNFYESNFSFFMNFSNSSVFQWPPYINENTSFELFVTLLLNCLRHPSQ